MSKSLVLGIVLCVALAGCASGPAKWAADLVGKMRCGMSIQEVEAVAAKIVKPLNRDWGTHFVEDGSTDVWLTFEKNQLKAYQIAWTRGLTIVEKRERVDLCKQR